ncbi:MAG: ABC transporter permease [Desulfomicrobium sp.]|nr:ABC transporter permease [Desulfomicrobium sp.]
MRKLFSYSFLPLYVPIVFLVVWHFGALWFDNEMILPPAGQVGTLLIHPFDNLIAMGSLVTNTVISLARVMAGYSIGILLAVPLGIALGSSPFIGRLLTGFLGLFRSVPPLAWVPLFLAWFGVASLASSLNIPYGDVYPYFHNIKLSMIAVIFIGCFFPMLTSTIHGVHMVPTTFLDAARVLGASKTDIFFKVLLPCAAPSIVNGMRIGLGIAWMCLVAAEMLPGSLSGVGYLITHAFTIGRIDVVIAGMVCIGATGALLDWIFRILEERKFIWKRLTR